MTKTQIFCRWHKLTPVIALCLLAACNQSSDVDRLPASPIATDSNAPVSVSAVAVDGFNRFNYRRAQMGEAPLTRDSNLDFAAQAHSNYQSLNGLITHVQTIGKPGFTGVEIGDRLAAAGYQLPKQGYSYGEVISATGAIPGADAAEQLIAAIYHRFLIFEPMFRDAGIGATATPTGYTYFTTDLATRQLSASLGRGKLATYPVDGQQEVPNIFYSDQETPDPVPNLNEVGYPVSVHADLISSLQVRSFTIQPRGGMPLATRLLSAATDFETPESAAAIIPLAVLAPATTYDVAFDGVVDNLSVRRNWSFTTR